jgi:hypothetical protein
LRSTANITGAILGHRKALLVVGSAAAVLGVGSASASAATVAPAGHARVASASAASVAPAAHARAASHHRSADKRKAHGSARPESLTWSQVLEIQAHKADPRLHGGHLPAADQLRPVAVYGPQESMLISPAQHANATTIVKQALAKNMGVRSAVIAVATSMQESELNNIAYGTGDSLGLFQQQADCGWGTHQQIMDPTYASDAFLSALQKYQVANPGWAHEPLWQSAQGVQASGFPTAYAKWEVQAAGLVQSIAMHLTK